MIQGWHNDSCMFCWSVSGFENSGCFVRKLLKLEFELDCKISRKKANSAICDLCKTVVVSRIRIRPRTTSIKRASWRSRVSSCIFIMSETWSMHVGRSVVSWSVSEMSRVVLCQQWRCSSRSAHGVFRSQTHSHQKGTYGIQIHLQQK